MSTDYHIKGNPITVSDLLKMEELVTNLKIETELSDDEFEPTILSKLNPNQCHRLRIKYDCDYVLVDKYFGKVPFPISILDTLKEKFGSDEISIQRKSMYLWAFVDIQNKIDSFCRYGMNEVSQIISLIEGHCKTSVIDEHQLFLETLE